MASGTNSATPILIADSPKKIWIYRQQRQHRQPNPETRTPPLFHG
jgi:hypothetical protein